MESIIEKRFDGIVIDGKPESVIVDIVHDYDCESPREFAISKMIVREHRRYVFPKELTIDLDDLDDASVYDEETGETVSDHEWKKLEGCHVFFLDFYEHSGISFSISGTGTNCAFDTASEVGIIAVPKTLDGFDYSETEARKIAEKELELYNAYANGECYRYSVDKIVPLFFED